MPFTNVIDNYASGTTGTLNTTDGGTVGYTVSGNAATVSRAGTVLGARVNGNATQTVQVDFDQTVHGMTISVNRSNPGEVYFIEIDGVQIDLNSAIADGTVVFTQAGAATHTISATGGITSTGSPTNGSLGFLHFQSPVNSVRIFGTGGSTGNFDLFEIGIDSEDFRVVCFGGNSRIATPFGQIKVSDLKSGDVVHAMDGGIQTIVRATARKVSSIAQMRDTRLAPVRIRAGALGFGLPNQDLLVSRQHRILVASRIVQRLCGKAQVLIPAIRLVGLPGIDVERSLTPITYYHILFECHDLVFANGAPAESLFVGAVSKEVLDEEPVEVDLNGTPDQDVHVMAPARVFPDAKLSKKIIAAHKRHERPLLEGLFEAPKVANGAIVLETS